MANNNKRRGCGCFGWVIVLIAIGFVLSLFTNGSDESTDKLFDETEITTDNTYDTTEEETEKPEKEDNHGDIYNKVYPQLNSIQQGIYNTLLEGVARGENNYKFNNVTLQDFDRAFTAFSYDHPEFFWLSTSYTYSYSTKPLTIELEPYSYWVYTFNPDKYVNSLNAEVDKIVKGASRCTTTYDKVKYVHDYLAENVIYDYDMLDELDSSFRSTSTEQGLSIYGALVNGKAVCGGYSETFFFLMNKLGVDCHYIQGDAGGYHAWNCLEIDGEYYYMDVTWDDIDTQKDDAGNVLNDNGVVYRYFCVTSGEFSRTHTPDSDFIVPYANDTDYDYFKHSGYYLEKYDFQAASEALSRQAKQEIVSLKFGSKYELDRAVDDLLNSDRFSDISSFGKYKNKTLWYNTDEDVYVLWIYLN